MKWSNFFLSTANSYRSNLALLIGRLAFGGMMLTHGWPKLMSFGERAGSFPDPLGVGNEISLMLTVFAEFFCALLLMVGLGTRLVLIPLIITMFVAASFIHLNDPFSDKEMALLYFFGYLILMVFGPGKFSLDHLIFKKNK